MNLLVADTSPAESVAWDGSATGPKTHRDAEIVRWIGRVGGASIDHVRSRFVMGRTVAYRRTSALVAARLLDRTRLLHDEPALLFATHAGLGYVGAPLGVARLSPGSAGHWLACADVWVALESRYGADRVAGVRELVLAERFEGRAVASAKVGTLPNGSPRLHRPDLVVLGEERPVAVEVELSPKAPQRLERILAGWRKATCVERVVYVCANGATRRAVERAVKRARAEQRIEVTDLERVTR